MMETTGNLDINREDLKTQKFPLEIITMINLFIDGFVHLNSESLKRFSERETDFFLFL